MPTPAKPQTFNEVLAAAVEDLAVRGFESQEQVSFWLAKLRSAAERELGSEARVTESMRAAMDLIFERLIGRGKVVQQVPGIGRYTLTQVRPELRAELDRRILAAADLIKLRRREGIESTLARFQGWSTSIPPGGGKLINKKEVRAHVAKDMRTVRWEHRRVAIDQGHKLTANVAEIVARGNNAIAAEWHSNWRQANYDYRKDHKERDGQVYLIRNSWAHQAGIVKPGKAGYYDGITRPGQEIFCRCYARYILSPRQLPREMLTKKGEAWVFAGGDRELEAA